MNIKDQLTRIALKKVKFADDQTLAEKMASEAKRLRKYIQDNINYYYDDYTPIVYERTGNYRRALQVEDIADIKVKGNSIELSLYFDENLSMHESLPFVSQFDYETGEKTYYYLNQHESFVPQLMEFGWDAPRLEEMIGRKIYRLTYFDGIHAIRDGIAKFNRNNPLGIKIILPDALREY